MYLTIGLEQTVNHSWSGDISELPGEILTALANAGIVVSEDNYDRVYEFFSNSGDLWRLLDTGNSQVDDDDTSLETLTIEESA